MIGIARRLGKRVVAEGIENERQLQKLKSLGYTHEQGSLLGRPRPAEALRRMVQAGELVVEGTKGVAFHQNL